MTLLTNRHLLAILFFVLSIIAIASARSAHHKGDLLKDDYDYALEGIAIDYVTVRTSPLPKHRKFHQKYLGPLKKYLAKNRLDRHH
ncbi:hypothetical protein AB6A40_004095 [Gnathostoma spinigerum]|uniref:Uncharacterized protein n=1 Tax=Gnathostoma spinigerum TaxID=75299 RepID=A0ABD6EDT8_9BILA